MKTVQPIYYVDPLHTLLYDFYEQKTERWSHALFLALSTDSRTKV